MASGDEFSQAMTGGIERFDEQNRKSIEDQEKKFADACSAGNGSACYELARIYISGYREPNKAMQALRKGCALKDGNSCGGLSGMLQKGDEPLMASKALAKACSYGHRASCEQIAAHVLSDESLIEAAGFAKEMLDHLCDVDQLSSVCLRKALLLLKSTEPAELARARDVLRESCEDGHAASCRNLAIVYQNGHGTPRNKKDYVHYAVRADMLWNDRVAAGLFKTQEDKKRYPDLYDPEYVEARDTSKAKLAELYERLAPEEWIAGKVQLVRKVEPEEGADRKASSVGNVTGPLTPGASKGGEAAE